MSVSIERLRDYIQYITTDEECLNEIVRRMSVRYFSAFCRSGTLEVAEQARLKQGCLEDFVRELKAVLVESKELNE